MDDDLIERLQARCVYGDARLLMSSRHDPLSAEAAAEIYRLRAEIKRLKREVDVAESAMVRNHNRAEKAEAENKRLTKERDLSKEFLRSCIQGNNVLRKKAQKAIAERDEARSMLADAERDMRQRAADAAKAVAQAATIQAGRHPLQSRSHDDWMERDYGATMAAKAILSLPLKHADRDGGN